MDCPWYVPPSQIVEHTIHSSQSAVEVRLASKARRRADIVQDLVRDFITSSFESLILPSILSGWDTDSTLASTVERIAVSESSCPSTSLFLNEISLQIHTYQPSENDTIEEYANGAGDGGGDVLAASVCELPCRSWEGLWEGLIYSDNIKLKLLDYIYATLILSDANVDCTYVTFVGGLSLTTPSQPRFVEQSCTSSRTTWNGKNFSL